MKQTKFVHLGSVKNSVQQSMVRSWWGQGEERKGLVSVKVKIFIFSYGFQTLATGAVVLDLGEMDPKGICGSSLGKMHYIQTYDTGDPPLPPKHTNYIQIPLTPIEEPEIKVLSRNKTRSYLCLRKANVKDGLQGKQTGVQDSSYCYLPALFQINM